MKALVHYVSVVGGLVISKRPIVIRLNRRKRKERMKVKLAPHQGTVRKLRNQIPTFVHRCW